jgi:hypothetical protein
MLRPPFQVRRGAHLEGIRHREQDPVQDVRQQIGCGQVAPGAVEVGRRWRRRGSKAMRVVLEAFGKEDRLAIAALSGRASACGCSLSEKGSD